MLTIYFDFNFCQVTINIEGTTIDLPFEKNPEEVTHNDVVERVQRALKASHWII